MSKIYLVLAYAIGIFLALGFGFMFTVSNSLQDYITCWFEGIVTNNQTLLNGSGCDNATYLAQTGQLSDALKIWALFSAVVNLGAIVGALVGGPICDFMGRKNGIIANAVLNIVVSVFYSAGRLIGSIWFFVLMRACHGVVGGIYCAIGPVWLEEVAPLKYSTVK